MRWGRAVRLVSLAFVRHRQSLRVAELLMLSTCLPAGFIYYAVGPIAMGSHRMSAWPMKAMCCRCHQTASDLGIIFCGTDRDGVAPCCVAECDWLFSGYQPAMGNCHHILWDRLRLSHALFSHLN